MNRSQIVKLLHSQYTRFGGAKYMINEPISILSHSTQSATWIMRNLPYHNPKLVVSALLHDYGHIVHGVPISPDTKVDDRHEIVGADALSQLGFSQDVTEPIRLHVMAKRYLCTINPYYELSEGSKKSLMLQGGPMRNKELYQFERNRYFNDALILRHADDGGKDDFPLEGQQSILDFSDMIRSVLKYP